jgi:hypothetical protein
VRPVADHDLGGVSPVRRHRRVPPG